MKKVILTGSKGAIGAELLKKLIRKYKVITINSNLTKKAKIINESVDFVLHFAATVKPRDNFKNPINVIENNIFSTINLIKEIKKLDKKPVVIFASTSQIANDFINFTKNDKKINEKIPLIINNSDPKSSYGYSKILCEKIIQMSGLNYIIIRISNIYGVKKNNDIFNYLVDQIKHSKEINIKNYKFKCNWLHIDDLCSAILEIMKSKLTINQIINLAGNETVSNIELANKISKIAKKKIKIRKKISHKKIKDFKNYSLNIRKIKSLTKWKPKVNLDYGITNFLRKYKN